MFELGDKLYLRKVKLSVSNASGLKDFTGLRIKFDIEKTNEGKPNKAKISIYNLNDDSRRMLEDFKSRIILSAGYEQTYGVIFSGNIIKSKIVKKKSLVKTPVQHKFEAVDIVTEIEAGDGDNKYRNARLHRAFPVGTKLREVINELANAFGLPANIDFESIAKDYQFKYGFSIDSLCRFALDELCKTHGLEWSIQNEILQIISKDKTTKSGAIILNPHTGLIGSPTRMTNGVEFDSLLQPALQPGCLVKIESKFINGSFKVRKVTHSGDSHEGEFLSKCEATTWALMLY